MTGPTAYAALEKVGFVCIFVNWWSKGKRDPAIGQTLSSILSCYILWLPVCDVSYGIDGSVDADILLVDDEAQGWEQGGVDEGDAEADDADGDHQQEVVGAEGNDEAGDAWNENRKINMVL